MIFRNLDSLGDWTFGNGLGNYATKNAAIGLNIKTRLMSWVNDCFFDLSAGIDWVNRLGSKNQQTLLQNDLLRVVSQTDGVIEVVNFDYELNGRNFKANYTVNTTYSTLQDSIGVTV